MAEETLFTYDEAILAGANSKLLDLLMMGKEHQRGDPLGNLSTEDMDRIIKGSLNMTELLKEVPKKELLGFAKRAMELVVKKLSESESIGKFDPLRGH